MTNQLLQFSAGKLIETPITLNTELLVAGSWLVEEGRARSLGRHFERFSNWVDGRVGQVELEAFFDAVREAIPKQGSWFPRIELHGGVSNSLHLRLREAPEQLGAATLWTFNEPDPRVNPSVKGPDLALGMQLRRRANMLGADEAVIVDQAGYVCEGALSSLVWWRGETLCAPNSETAWLESVTREEVFAIAEQMGLATRTEKAKPADLVETEVWMLSSLQGIRPVTNWLELGGPLAQPTHVEAFNKRLRLLATAI